jgi:NAD(P)-dependent dehydrogenase (short-subunit alcohol dehydrogenase family)
VVNERPAVSFSLVGSPAIVTGGASGIGRRIVLELAASGADVVVFDRQPADDLVAEVEGLGTGAAVAVHVVRACFDVAEQRFGVPRVLVNNATGPNRPSLIVGTEPELLDTLYAVVLRGTFLVTREFARRNIASGVRSGVVVNTSTVNAVVGSAGLAAYCSMKAAVTMLTKVAALELASSGIRVVAVAPGLTNTPALERMFGSRPDVTQQFVDRIPMERVGDPADIARIVAFLASDGASWITGDMIFADGGMHLVGVPDTWDVMAAPLGLSEPTAPTWTSAPTIP